MPLIISAPASRLGSPQILVKSGNKYASPMAKIAQEREQVAMRLGATLKNLGYVR